LNNPRVHFDSIVALMLHAIILAVLVAYSPINLLLLLLVPSAIAAATGAYFFYAQHNFPTMMVRERSQWDYVAAAVESSSFIRMGALMHWFTGNIGYHHVHHLNSHIPFYRLPEAMTAIPELRSPRTTSLSLGDIRGCLRLKLWDTASERLVGFDHQS
jgi:omega-6 fatty acid desaturase (delta-12 desaturase)